MMSTAEPLYPLYVVERDCLAVRNVQEYAQLDYYERIDVEEGNYFLWDSSGTRFEMTWSEPDGCPSFTMVRSGDIDCMALVASIYRAMYGSYRRKRGDDNLCTAQELDGVIARLRGR